MRERCDVMANRSDREQGQPTECRRRHSLINRMGPCSRTPSGPAVSIDCINRPDRRLHPTTATTSIYLLQRGGHPQRTFAESGTHFPLCNFVMQHRIRQSLRASICAVFYSDWTRRGGEGVQCRSMKYRAARTMLGDLHRATPWLWLYCEKCSHLSPLACAVVVIRWGADPSSDKLWRSARCTACGRKGATIQRPS